jgi:hypothetical protein
MWQHERASGENMALFTISLMALKASSGGDSKLRSQRKYLLSTSRSYRVRGGVNGTEGMEHLLNRDL